MIDRTLPLVELHRHLDGSIRLQTILELADEHDIALPGVGDAGAHSSVFTDAAAATNLLTWWSRDRPADRGPQMTLEHAVHKHTAAIADFYEMHDRGVVAA